MIARSLALMLALISASCSVPSAECTAAPDRCKATAAQVAPPAAPTWTVLIGDSITALWSGHWPAATTTNYGRGYLTACLAAAGTWQYPGWIRADTVYIHIGVNDINLDGKTGAQAWACLDTMRAKIIARWPAATVIIISTLGEGNGVVNCAAKNAALANLRALIAASGYAYVDTWAAMSEAAACGTVLRAAYTLDGVHLNAAGYAAWAAALGL
jgi:hypothetical protein